MVREIQQGFVLRLGLLRRLQKAAGGPGRSILIDKVLNRFEEQVVVYGFGQRNIGSALYGS